MGVADITELGLARLVGLKVRPGDRGSRVVTRWKTGENKIPYSAWALLAHRAGYGIIWEKSGSAVEQT
jgi:hypothetical protein